ncbi:hypothetical protein PC116_g967 [Phytophthora cactorum]|uniref:Uncharacterized protein n=1 Tax=Phytophthora cactorum TaxID=29920 RepID=A0A8T1EPJ9_9STRA|nr:hypothetical protein Pcac1_g21936 [Phytophthora cactorum]KAG2955746.1 hypothetical protein PC117_g200 [Phytophthora cactorum]KAG4251379.1 hypothetical protein PC116_g967 [Phytophthora cactorum]
MTMEAHPEQETMTQNGDWKKSFNEQEQEEIELSIKRWKLLGVIDWNEVEKVLSELTDNLP